MNKVHLIAINCNSNLTWEFGRVFFIKDSISDFDCAIKEVSSFEGLTLFWNFNNGPLDISILSNIKFENVDIWHGNYSDNLFSFPKLFHKVYPCWLLNLYPKAPIDFICWKIQFHCLIVNNRVFKDFKLDTNYKTPKYAALDLGYRLIRGGKVPFFKMDLKSLNTSPIAFEIKNIHDELIFVKKHTTSKLFQLALFYSIFYFKDILQILLSKVKFEKNLINENENKESIVKYDHFGKKISVILITLGRYDYIGKVIDQLLDQTILPTEIIVVDGAQNNQKKNDEFYKKYGSIVKVFNSEIIGQCTQRNIAISKSIGDYLLFIDDDMDEIPSNHLEKHLNNLIRYNADVSNGTPDEVGAKKIFREQIPAVSDVFPTNDTLISKNILKKSGYFDQRMDKGQSEDHELGIRVFLNGGLMIKSYQLQTLHLRAPTGGLRVHGNRKFTYGSSRTKLFHFRLPHKTEIYFKLKYFPTQEIFSYLFISLLGTMSINGGFILKISKLIIAIFYFPKNFLLIISRYLDAKKLLKLGEIIPR